MRRVVCFGLFLLSSACTVDDKSGKDFSSGGAADGAPQGGAGGLGIGGAAAGSLGGGGLNAGSGSGSGHGGSSSRPDNSGGRLASAGATSEGGTSPVSAGAPGTGSSSTLGGGTAEGGAGGSTAGGNSNLPSGGAAPQGGITGTTPNTTGGAASACDQQLLQNPGFESGNAQWLLETNFAGVVPIVRKDTAALMTEGVQPQQGQYLAWLGGVPDNKYDSHYISLSQVIRIPAEANLVRLKGYVRVATQETIADESYDRAYIQLEYPDDRPDLLWLPAEWTMKDASQAWVAFEATLEDTAKVRGQDVLLRMRSETDPNLVTSFWLDSLELTVRCGR